MEQIVIKSFDILRGMKSVEVLRVAEPRLDAGTHQIVWHPSLIKELPELFQLLPDLRDGSLVDLLHDSPGLQKEEPALQERESMRQLYDLSFLHIQIDMKNVTHTANQFQALLQVCLGMVDQISIIHVSAISFDMQLLFDVVIQRRC